MTTIIKLRRDTAANWTSENPILAAGEPGLETDTLRVKYGDGSNTWANLAYQAVGNATFATNATTANVANLVAVANVSGIGNIAVINLDGNAANALRGNGSFGPVDSVGTMISNGGESFAIDVEGNVVFEGNVAGQGINRGMVWDYGANANGVNSTVRQDNSGLTVRAYTQEGGSGNGYSAPVNIVTNQDANTNTWIFDGDGTLVIPGDLTLQSGNIVTDTFNLTFNAAITGINSGNANVIITIADELFEGPFSGQVTISGVNPPVQVNGNWWYQAVEIDQFQLFTDANLTTPVDGTSWPGYVDGGTAVSVATYTDFTIQGGNVTIGSNDKIWEFDTDGNLTLPGNTFAVNYANGTQVSLGGGNATFLGYNYTIGNAEVSGEFVISNTNPANVGTFSINPVDNANVNVENLLGYVSNSKLVTTICDNQSRQVTYDISGVETVRATYNGYKAVYSKLYDDDPAFCKIGFYQDTSVALVTTQTDTNDDEFTVNIDSGTSTLLGLAIIYTENSSFVPSNANLLEYVEYFVDNIITPAAGNITDLRNNFYDEIANTTAIISSWGEDPYNLNFYDNATNSIYTSVVPTTTSGSGIDFTANVVIAGDGTYRVISYVGGSGFNTSETITFDGTLFSGITVTNDLVLTITSVSSGVVTGFTIAGTNPGEWPTNFISDGGSDQYDTGNFLKTNQQTPVPYNDGEISNSGAFGGNDWFVGYAYGQFIFFGDNTGDPVGIFGTFGETGSDGSGTRITGYLNPPIYYTFNVNSVLDYNANLSFANGSFTLSYDIAGPNVGSITFNNNRTISVTSGDLTLNAPDDINIEPNDDLRLYGGDKQTSDTQGGDVLVYGGIGGPAFNAANDIAGDGGIVQILGGNAGNDDGNTALGASGGYVQLRGGQGTGNGTGGYVEITGGQGFNGGSGGNVTINGGTGPAQSVYGNVTVNVGSYNWRFGNDGNLTLPGNMILAGNTNLLGSDAALIKSNNGLPLLSLSTGANSSVTSIWLENYGDIGNSNIAAIYTPLPGTGNVRIVAGTNGANINIWDFATDGSLTIPGNLVANGASPAPTLSGFSSLSAADEIVVGSNAVVLTTAGDVSATGNISAVNIGNISSTTLDGNVSNVLTGNGTFVTLPVINANTVVWSTAPVSNVAAGNVGEAAYDSGGNLYICVVANTWSKFTGTTSW